MSSLEYHNPILDTKTGKVQFDVLMASFKGIIPTLKDAVIEVESINLFYGSERKIKKIDGKWELSVANLNNTIENLIIEYVMHDQQSILKVSTAIANPTSLNLTFSLDGAYEDENNFAHRMKIIDENGDEYYSDSGYSMDVNNNETIISTNFPITSYNNVKKLKLIVEGIGEVELLRK